MSSRAEEWLRKNCKPDDWDKLHEGLNDGLWTNNVLKYMDAYAEELLKEQQEKIEQKWIPVEEGLPDAYIDVLFFLKAVKGNGLIKDTILKDYTTFIGNKPRLKDDRATHWTPLPEPPTKPTSP